jgi:hypothetical protein
MPPQSDHAAGPLEFQKLLELLNESEEREEISSHGPPTHDEHNVLFAGPVSAEQPHHVEELPADPPDDVENRFAAHIVQGMSKIKRA